MGRYFNDEEIEIMRGLLAVAEKQVALLVSMLEEVTGVLNTTRPIMNDEKISALAGEVVERSLTFIAIHKQPGNHPEGKI